MNWFDKRLEELLAAYRRRIASIHAAQHGGEPVRRVRVKSYDVSAYSVSSHWRIVIPRRNAPVATKKRRAP